MIVMIMMIKMIDDDSDKHEDDSDDHDEDSDKHEDDHDDDRIKTHL